MTADGDYGDVLAALTSEVATKCVFQRALDGYPPKLAEVVGIAIQQGAKAGKISRELHARGWQVPEEKSIRRHISGACACRPKI